MKTYDETVNEYVKILANDHANWITTGTIDVCTLVAYVYDKSYLEVFTDVERINRESFESKINLGPVAQRSVQETHNLSVVGSNPTRPTITK
jgi:hypothetical protein